MSIKKLAIILLAFVLAAGFAGCGTSGSGGSGESSDSGDSSFTWSREGTFADENKNYVIITKPDDGEHDGMWAVSVLLSNGDVHGWFLEPKGETLYGNLNSEYDENDDDYIVTISEEGDDGLMMEVEGGETYHFVKEEEHDYIALLKINTDGLGSFAYAPEGEEVKFDDEFPTQSAAENLEEPKTFVIKAKPDEGWKFVKWTKNGEDFSTEPDITVEVSEDVEYIAVFNAE